MEISIIIGLVLYALAIILTIKLAKNVLIAIGTILLISVLLVAGTGFFIYSDISGIQDRLPSSNNLILLREGDDVHAGVAVMPGESFSIENLVMLDDDPLQRISDYMSDGEDDAMFGVVRTSDFMDEEMMEELDLYDETYKILFVDMTVLEDSPADTIDVSSIAGGEAGVLVEEIPKETSLEMIRDDSMGWSNVTQYINVDGMMPDTDDIEASLEDMGMDVVDTGEDELRDEMLEGIREGLVEEFGNDDIGGFFFFLSMASIIDHQDGMRYLLDSYRDEDIYVEESSITFDLLRMSPDVLLDAVLSETQGLAEEASSYGQEQTQDEAPQQVDSPEEDVDIEDPLEEMDEEEIQDMVSDDDIEEVAEMYDISEEEAEDMIRDDISEQYG